LNQAAPHRGGPDSCAHPQVVFDDLSKEDIEAYVASGEPYGKAGAYGIQGLAGSFVRRIDGCFYNGAAAGVGVGGGGGAGDRGWWWAGGRGQARRARPRLAPRNRRGPPHRGPTPENLPAPRPAPAVVGFPVNEFSKQLLQLIDEGHMPLDE
jgi:hypothetical protein